MNTRQYLKDSARTNGYFPEETPMEAHQMHLIHAAMGLTSEAGEFADNIKRHIFYGTPIDYRNLEEEIGDMCWYMALALREIGSDFEQVLEMNIAKLQERYPHKFDNGRAVTRDLEKEKNAMISKKDFAN